MNLRRARLQETSGVRDTAERRLHLAYLLVPVATLLVFITLVALFARSLSLRGMEAGSISLDDVSLQQEAGQLYLSASTEINLPEPIRDGLDSGVPLDFILTLTLRHPRRLWMDQTLAEYQHRFRLTYYELTRHYRVHAIDSDTSRNYRSLSAALQGLGEFKRLPMAIDAHLRPGVQALTPKAASLNLPAATIATLTLRLDYQSLPLPLQPLIASSWRLASEEYQWQLD